MPFELLSIAIPCNPSRENLWYSLMTYVAYIPNKVKWRLAESPLHFNGSLCKLGLIYLVKVTTEGTSWTGWYVEKSLDTALNMEGFSRKALRYVLQIIGSIPWIQTTYFCYAVWIFRLVKFIAIFQRLHDIKNPDCYIITWNNNTN